MRFIKVFLIFSLLSSCKKQNNENIQIIGHAGMGLSMQNSIYHDNSFQAIKLALSYQGSNGVEVDVQMDKEGCLWLYHNDFLQDESNGNGCINDKQTKELEKITYKTIQKEKLTKLEQILSLRDSSQNLFLDNRYLNPCSNTLIDVQAFETSLTKLGITNMKNVHMIIPNENWAIQLSQTYSICYCSDNFELANQFLIENPQVTGLVIRNKYISKSQVNQIKNMERKVYLYDIRSPKGNRLALSKFPTGIITDDIRAALIERN